MITSEISISGDHLRLERKKVGKFAGPRDLTNQICPELGNLTKKFPGGGDLTGF